MKNIAAAVLFALAATSAFADKPAITVILSDESTMTQGMAMVLANQMQDQGAQVDILLCDKAGDLALEGSGGESLKPVNATPAQLLDGAMKKGASVSVCALYLPNSGHTPDALKKGVTPAKPDAMARVLMEPNRKVIGF